MKRSTLLLTLILPLLTACTGETPKEAPKSEAKETRVVAPPSQEVASSTIANAPEFSEYKFTRAAYSLPMQGSMLKGPARESAEDLAAAGWVAIDSSGNLLLMPTAEKDKRFIVRDNGSLDIVPLARKEFVSVDGIGHDDEGDVTIDFTWRWAPNEVAKAFVRGAIATRYEGDQKARATIYPTKSGWSVMRIVEIEQPAPESTGT